MLILKDVKKYLFGNPSIYDLLQRAHFGWFLNALVVMLEDQ